MRLRDLLPHIVDDVCIYVQSEIEGYEDIFTGKLADAPSSVLEKKVRLIGVTKKNMLDIQIWN